MSIVDVDQQEIVEGLKALDPTIIDRFVEHYSGPLFGVVINYTKNPYDAEEIVQDTFLIIIKKIETFRDENDIWFWMKRIAINNGLMWLRRHTSRVEKTIRLEEVLPAFTKLEEFAHPASVWHLSPEDVCSQSELADHLSRAIQSLPRQYRVPLILKDIEGCSSKEISSTLGLTQPTTNTRIHRARLALRKKLARYFLSG